MHEDRPPRGQREPDSNHKHWDNGQRSITEVIRVTGKVEANLPPDFIEKYHSSNKDNDTRESRRFIVEIVTLGFVALVAIFGLIQTSEAIKSAGAAQSAAETAKHSLLVTAHSERAWMGLKSFDLTSIGPNKPVRFHIEFTNSGRSPALNVKAGISFLPLDSIRTDASKQEQISKAVALFKLQPQAPIAPGQVLIFDKSTDTATYASGLTQQGFEAVQKGTSYLYIPGRVEFDDIYLRPQWTTFCLVIGATGSGDITMLTCPFDGGGMSYQREDK